MLFSICIPVYNTSQYLDACLQSVLNQTEKDYEIVLVNDGSTDHSGEICDRYAAEYPNIRVIHKQNEGLLMTRRRGFQEAQGDYFICLDSDDALNDVEALKKIKSMIEDKDVDLILYDYIYGSDLYSDKADRYISLFDYPDGYVFQVEEKKKLYHKLLLGNSFNPIFIKAAHRNIVDINTSYDPWKESLVNSQAEDLLQSLPILDAAQKIAYIKAPLYFYRWNPNSISKNVRPDYYYAYRTVYQRTDEYLKKWDFQSKDVHLILQKRLNMIFSVLLAKSHPNHDQWIQVLRNVSEDPFFIQLWSKRDSTYICRYYMLMGHLLLKKKFVIFRLTKKCVESLVNIKKYILRGNV